MRLLLIEDDPKLAPLLTRGLREEGFAVDATADGDDGAWRAVENEYDAILLDVNLPGMDGLEVLERLRAKGRRTPVLMFSARGGGCRNACAVPSNLASFPPSIPGAKVVTPGPGSSRQIKPASFSNPLT